MIEDGLDEAWRQVGRFMYQFARVEAALNNIVKRVLDLENAKGEYIIAQVDFVRKVHLAINAIEAEKDRHIPLWADDAAKTIKKLLTINNHRRLFAHQPYQTNGAGGLVFCLEGAREKAKVDTFSKATLEALHLTMAELELELGILHHQLRPILDFGLFPAFPQLDPSMPRGLLSEWADDLRLGNWREGAD